jgi:outer membrane protein OmpA-like peptidoglycan-associated protein
MVGGFHHPRAGAGGRYEIAAPGGNGFRGRLTEFEPPNVINFSGVTRFELSATPAGCRMVVTVRRWPNGWSPMQLAGFHCQFEQLGLHLDGLSADEISQRVRTWRHVYPAYEWLVRQNISDGDAVSDRVHFAEGAIELREDATPTLERVAALAASRADIKIELAGHCDDPCSSLDAVDLARRRIDAVRARLVSAGVAAERIMSVGGGNFHQLVPSDTAEGRAFNRRVELRPAY